MSKTRTVRVLKSALVERLTANREQHDREFQEAMGGYKSRLVLVLTRMLEAAKKKEAVSHQIQLTVPKDHFAEYDRALEIMKWEQEDVLDLPMESFDRYVLDRWSWKKKFATVHSSYITPSR